MAKPKKKIGRDEIVVVEIMERITGFSGMNMVILPANHLENIPAGRRAYLISSHIAWIHLAQEVLDGRLDLTLVHDEELPPLEKMSQHVVNSLRRMEKMWPMEAAFVHECLPDAEAALMMITPPLIPNAMDTIGSFLPTGYPGVVARYSSPAIFHHQRP